MSETRNEPEQTQESNFVEQRMTITIGIDKDTGEKIERNIHPFAFFGTYYHITSTMPKDDPELQFIQIKLAQEAIVLKVKSHTQEELDEIGMWEDKQYKETYDIFAELCDIYKGVEGKTEFERANKAVRRYESRQTRKQLHPASTAKPSEVYMPLTKITTNLPRLIKDMHNRNEISSMFSIVTGQRIVAGTKKAAEKKVEEVQVPVFLDLQELGKLDAEALNLTAEDMLIFTAVSNLSYSGNEYITLQSIYSFFHDNSNPNKKDLERISKSIEKMSRIRIRMDNKDEAKVLNYGHFVYNGNLLQSEVVTAYTNGQITSNCIRILDTPFLFKFALNRKQVQMCDKDIFKFPLGHTESTNNLFLYMLTDIARNNDRRMKISTLMSEANAETKKQKQDTLRKIHKLMEHFKKCKLIADYEVCKEYVSYKKPNKKLLKSPKATSKED